MPLAVNAHNLLTDRRPSARDNARLRDGRMRRITDKARRIDSILPKDGAEGIASCIRAANPRSIRAPAECRRIVCHICRTARHDALRALLEDEHGCLARDARDCSVEVDIRHHVPNDKYGGIL